MTPEEIDKCLKVILDARGYNVICTDRQYKVGDIIKHSATNRPLFVIKETDIEDAKEECKILSKVLGVEVPTYSRKLFFYRVITD